MEYQTSVEIAADPELVWRTLMDIVSWPKWTDTVTWLARVEDEPLGQGSDVQIKQPRLKAAVWTVSAFEPRKSFSWTNSGAGVITQVDHEIAPTESGTTVTFRIIQSGLLSGISSLVGGSATRRMIDTQAAGLRAFCESGTNPAETATS
ncbi:MAG: SRPBCC family protein [Microthrixaceae bacterium]